MTFHKCNLNKVDDYLSLSLILFEQKIIANNIVMAWIEIYKMYNFWKVKTNKYEKIQDFRTRLVTLPLSSASCWTLTK